MGVLSNIRYLIRSRIGYSPFLLKLVAGNIRRLKAHVVNGRTDLVIEAYPRSASTWAVASFMYLYDGNLRIASHMHSIGQIKASLKRGKPVLVIVRRPEDAILSLAVRRADVSTRLLIREYIGFHEALLGLRDRVLIVDFDEVTSDLNGVIRRLNEKYALECPLLADTPGERDEIFHIIDRMEEQDGGGRYRITHVARPNPVRNNSRLRKDKSEELKKHAKLLDRAASLYREIAGSSP